MYTESEIQELIEGKEVKSVSFSPNSSELYLYFSDNTHIEIVADADGCACCRAEIEVWQ